jgi:hypothetical protein
MAPDEAAIIGAFVSATKRRRYGELLRTKGGRVKVIAALAHFTDSLDMRFAYRIAPNRQNPAAINEELSRLGAPDTCFVISEDSDIDGLEMSLSDALDQIIEAGNGAIVSCITGHLAFYHSEEPGERYILHRVSR